MPKVKGARRPAVKKKAQRPAARKAEAPPLAAPSAPETDLERLQDRASLAASILLTALVLLFIQALNIVPAPLKISVVAGDIAPEPKERLQFLAALLCFPLFFIGLRQLARKAASFFPRLDASAALVHVNQAFGVLLVLLAWKTFTGQSRFNFEWASMPIYYLIYFRNTWVVTHFWPVVAGAAALCALLYARHRRGLEFLGHPWVERAVAVACDLAAALLIIRAGSFCIDNYTNWHHFEAMYYSMTQVYFGGKTLYVDFMNQYGLYPHFLEPFFKLSGDLSEWRFRVAMAVLVLISFTALWGFLRRAISVRPLGLLAFYAVVYYTYLIRIFNWGGDPYLQYHPIRFIVPCVASYLALRHFQLRTRASLYLTHAVVALGVLWNTESGIVTLVAWGLTLAYDGAATAKAGTLLGWLPEAWKGLVSRAKGLLLFLAGFFALYLIIMVIRSGQIPGLLKYLQYQSIFYGSGFYMMPMTLVHPWLLVALAFMAAIGGCVSFLYRGSKPPAEAALQSAALMLALIGCGMFSYFQGRSHDTNILHGLYVPVILSAMFLDRAVSRAGFTRLSEGVAQGRLDWGAPMLAAVMAFFLLGPLGFTWKEFVKTGTLAADLKSKWLKETPERYAYLAPYFRRGEEVLSLLEDQAISHSATKTHSPFKGPGRSEMILSEDMDRLRKFLAEEAPGRKLILFGRPPDGFMNHYALRPHSAYQPEAIIANQFAEVWAQPVSGSASALAPLLGASGQLFHCVNAKPLIYTRLDEKLAPLENLHQYTGLELKGEAGFSVEMLIEPPQGAAAGQEILVNADADRGFRLRAGGTDTELQFSWGEDQDERMSIPLAAGRRNYLVLSCGFGRVRAYVDGKKVGDMAGTVKDSVVPVSFHTKWNAYPGKIQELKISKGVKNEAEIRRTASKVSIPAAAKAGP